MRSLKEQQLSAAAAELQVQSLELELESGETRALQPQHPASTFSFSIITSLEFFYQKYNFCLGPSLEVQNLK